MGLADDQPVVAVAETPASNIALTMASPAFDSALVDELVKDVDAYLNRLTVLTDFAESQVEERIRLARIVNKLASDCDALQARITELDLRLRKAEGSVAARLSRAPRRLWRVVRRSPRG